MYLTPIIVVFDSGRRSESFLLCKYVFYQCECQHQCCDANRNDCRRDDPVECIFDGCVLFFHCLWFYTTKTRRLFQRRAVVDPWSVLE